MPTVPERKKSPTELKEELRISRINRPALTLKANPSLTERQRHILAKPTRKML